MPEKDSAAGSSEQAKASEINIDQNMQPETAVIPEAYTTQLQKSTILDLDVLHARAPVYLAGLPQPLFCTYPSFPVRK